MRKELSYFLFVMLVAGRCHAQGPCYVSPGGVATVQVPLVSNSFEPACEPQRIRVDDRTPVTIRVLNVSPTEQCIPAAPAPTPTTVASPLETIINTISGLKSFNLVQASNFQARVERIPHLFIPPATPPKTPEPPDPTLVLFHDLSAQVLPAAQRIATKQTTWQRTYQSDLTQISDYATADYRGTSWGNFDPEQDPDFDGIRTRITFPPITADASDPQNPPSELDYVPLQALVDQLKALQPRLIDACTSTTSKKNCDKDILASTAAIIEQANSYLSVAGDNLKVLQAAQSAIVTGYNGLLQTKHLFDGRVESNVVSVVALPHSPQSILVQPIPLGSNYAVNAPGTISCSTLATPSVATTDAINFTVQYQKVPALTVSSGLLISFIEQNQFGVSQQLESDGKTIQTAFVKTNSARASVVPMAFVNYRIAAPIVKTWWGEPNQELDISHNVSAGIGINANTGTNQPEFFGGYAIGFSRALIHLGLDYGRSESLGGGFSLGPVPTGFMGTTAPISWKYHPQFSIGVSVRIAPF